MVFLKKLGVSLTVSAGVGLLVLSIGYLYSNSEFRQWQLLGKPSESISKIVGTTMDSVTVETVSKTLYTYNTISQDNLWVETSETPVNQYSDIIQCEIRKPSDEIIDIQECNYLDPGGQTTAIYALREDGNVYLWYGRTGLGDLGWIAVLLWFPLGAIVGFILTWIFFFFQWLRSLP